MSSPVDVSVLVAAHNSDPVRLKRTLAALRAQSLPVDDWELLIVDNASSPPLDQAVLTTLAPPNLQLLRETRPGLSWARRCGLQVARGSICVLVDDDNVLAPDYLERARRIGAEQPRLGAFGGKVLPEFEREPPAWAREFLPLLALRDLGPAPRISSMTADDAGAPMSYPIDSAPVGAGMVVRREAVDAWLRQPGNVRCIDRRGKELTSGGDNDIVLTLVRGGWLVGYFPELLLTHLIPAARLTPNYLGRLNRGIQRSWLEVLAHHQASPWPPIPGWTVPLRKAKAWFACRAWSGPAERIRWHGACGHFEGRVA